MKIKIILFSLSLFLSLSSFAESHFDEVHLIHKKIQHLQNKGVQAVQKFQIRNSFPLTQKTILFCFDLDETLTNYAYKGKKAEKGEVHLKPGISDLFTMLLNKNHEIAIITSNISKDLESFLMDELGFDYTKEEEYSRFRALIHVKQPALTKYLKRLEFLKLDKGQMLSELLSDLKKDGRKIDGIIFSDDKTGFHTQVLSKDFGIPIVGLRVGHRPHTFGDPVGSFLDKTEIVPAGTSMEFARLVFQLSVDAQNLSALLYYANGSLLSNAMIVKLNDEILHLSPWDFGDINEWNIENNKSFGPWLMSHFDESHKLYSDTKIHGSHFHRTRKFFRDQKPIAPRYLKNKQIDL